MFKNLLLYFLVSICIFSVSFAQPLNVNNIVTTGRLLSCSGPTPVVTVTYVSGPGSTVVNGNLVCLNPCDSTLLDFDITFQWNQTPGINWIHGFFFPPGGATGFSFVSNNLNPMNWNYDPIGCTGTCPPPAGGAAIVGGAGYYFTGGGQACCPGGGTTPSPCDNYGDSRFNCLSNGGMLFNVGFRLKLCNSLLNGSPRFIRLRATADGNTGCWNIQDANSNLLDFQFNTVACAAPLFTPNPASTPPVQTCNPAQNFTASYTGGCGNGTTITWWTASTGGTQVGSGSPFVYDPPGSACPGTLYAQCCPNITSCVSRRAVSGGACAAPLAINYFTSTSATCTNATASIDATNIFNGNAPFTYTLNPGNVTNITGIFPGLTPGTLYTILVTDAGGCQATKDTTFAPPTNCCGPAPVPQGPVTFCQNATTAVPLTAVGTALLWYTTPTGGTGSATAPTPSTATAGTFTFYVTQTVSGCESPRAAIVVTITPLATITLTSAAATNNQSVCINTAITNITYATANGVTGASVTGLPAGVTGAFNAGTGVVTISGTASAAGTFNYTVTTTGGCTPPTATGVIIVNPLATIVLSSAAATTSQTVCINTAITNITYTVAGGATGASVTGLPAGVTSTYAAGVFTISGTPTVAGTFNYTVSTTGGCGVATSLGTVTVTANVTLTLTSAAATTSQTVCANTAIVNITYTTGSGATGATITGLPTGVTGIFAGGVVTISGSPTAVGTFPYTVTTTGGCSSATLNGTITVTPGAATLTLSSAPATTTQTVCINTAIADITYVTGGGATGGSVTGLPAGVTGTYSAGTITISGTPTVSGVFSYTASTTGSGSCGSPTQTGTITINNNATITLTSAPATTTQAVCVNTAITNITYSTANGVTGASVTGLPSGVASSFVGGIFTISGTPTATGVFPYTVTTTGGCASATATGTITVNTLSTITLSSAAATTTQTLCISTALTNITYTTGGGATGAAVTGLPAGVTGSYAGGTFTISGTPAASGSFPYTVSTTGGCGVATATGTITVHPAMTIVLTSAAATTSQTVCANIAINNIVYTLANGATSATVTGLPTGVTGTFAAGVFTISGSPTAVGTFNYTVSAAGGCGTASLTGSITVTPGAATLTLTSAPATANQTVCINTAITTITYVTGGGASGGTVTGLPAGVTGTFSAGTITIVGTPTVAGIFNYSVTTTGSGSCGSPSLAGVITVNSNATIALSSAAGTDAQTVCINTAITNITYTTTNGVTGATVTGLPAGVTGSFAAGVFTISGTPTASGTFNYTITTSGGCTVTTATGTITVNTLSTITLSSAVATTTQTLCINTLLTNITYTTGGGATGATVTGLPAGFTGSYAGGTFTISGTPTASGSFPYTVSTTGGCGVATATGTITVNPAMTIVLTSAAATTSQTVCANIAINNIVYTLANGATSATVTGLPAGVTGTFAGGVFTISGSPTAVGTFNYTVSAAGGCGTASLTGSITVTPGAATLILSSAPATANQTVCINTAITTITYVTGGGASGGTVTGLPAGVTGTYSAGTITITGTPTVAGTFNYTVNTTGSGSCGSPSLAGVIIVNPNATIALSSAAGTDAQTVCINTAITNITYATTNGVTGATVTGLPAGVTGSFAGGVFTISGTPTASGTFNYTITTSGGCTVVTASGTITVSPVTTITLTSAPATSNQTVSINTPITTITYSVANGGTSATVTGLPAGVTGSFAGGIFTITGSPTVVGTFPYTVTTSGGCGVATLTGTIIVNDLVTLTLSSAPGTANQTVCINTAIVNITYAAAGGATGASITAGALPTGVTGVYNAGVFTISGTPTVTGTFNYTVTTSGGVGVATLSGTIIVNPNATIALSSAASTTTQTICINTAITNITYTIANGGTGATVTGLPAGVTGSFAGGIFTISGTATVAGTFPYTVTTTGGCLTASLTGTITVNPNATITLSSAAATNAQTICINTAITNITYTVAAGGTGATVTGLPAGVTGSFAGGVFTISGTATATGTFAYTVTTTGGCSFATATGTITVNANVTIALSSAAATAAQSLCINTAITNITYATTNGATGATVTGLPAGVTGSFAGGVFTITGTPTVAGTFPYTVTTAGGCSTATATGTITVNPAATIVLSSAAATAAQTVCINTAITNITYTVANGGTGATVTGLPAGVTGSFAGGVFTISGTPTIAGTFSYTVSTSGGCGIAPISGTITVNANVTLVLTSAAATANQTVCINTAITNIVYTSANGATGATVTGLPAGVTGSFAGGVFTISGSPTVTGTFNYTVSTAGGCSLATQSGSIIVNPNATITLSSAATTTAQTLCENNAITNITYTVANGGTGATVTGLPAGVTGTYAGGVFTISGTPTAAGPFTYTVTTAGGCSSANLTGTITVVAYPNKPIVRSPVFYCPGDAPRPLSDSVTGTNLLWYTTATGGTGSSTPPTVNTSTPGITSYYVSQSNGNCEGPRDTIRVNVNNQIAINIGLDSTICEGDSVKYFPVVTPAASFYQWRAIGVPNSTIDSVNIKNATFFPINNAQYILRAGVGGCASEDTVNVNVRWKPIVDAGKNVPICVDGSTVLTGVITHTTAGIISDFVWTPKDSLSFDSALVVTAYPTKSTWYRLTVKTTVAAYGCAFTSYDSVKVSVQPIVRAFAGNDTIAVKGAPHQLQGSGGLNYQWSSPTVSISNPNTRYPFVTLLNDANFYVRVSDAIGCEGFDSVFVKVYDGPTYYIPNAFSPNGDGQNDIFRAIPVGISNTTYFRIFNRFGELMFETNQWLKGWDGTYKGKPQPSGAYVWIVKGTSKDNKTVEMKGTVMLVR